MAVLISKSYTWYKPEATDHHWIEVQLKEGVTKTKAKMEKEFLFLLLKILQSSPVKCCAVQYMYFLVDCMFVCGGGGEEGYWLVNDITISQAL